jgi:starvation-inducible DNA-binding protein
MPVHKFTEELYDGAFEAYDDVAERIKILGETPLSTMKDYLDGATIAEIAPKRLLGSKRVLSLVKTDLELLKARIPGHPRLSRPRRGCGHGQYV